jgi:hypothetical protein
MASWTMSKRQRRLPGVESQGIPPYRIDPEPLAGASSFMGLPLVAEAYRLGAGGIASAAGIGFG